MNAKKVIGLKFVNGVRLPVGGHIGDDRGTIENIDVDMRIARGSLCVARLHLKRVMRFCFIVEGAV